jgi:spore coat protein U-like protein
MSTRVLGCLIGLAGLAVSLSSPVASGATNAASIGVSATVAASCLTSVSVGRADPRANAASAVSVRCDNVVSYEVSVSSANLVGATYIREPKTNGDAARGSNASTQDSSKGKQIGVSATKTDSRSFFSRDVRLAPAPDASGVGNAPVGDAILVTVSY